MDKRREMWKQNHVPDIYLPNLTPKGQDRGLKNGFKFDNSAAFRTEVQNTPLYQA